MWRSQDARERPEAMQRVGLPPPAADNLAASSEVAAAVEPPPAHTMRENHAPQPSAGSLGRKMCLQLQRSQPVVPHTAPLAAAACSLVQQPSAAAPAPSPSMFQSLFGDMLLQQPGPPEAGEPWLRLDRFQQHAAAGGPWEAPPGLMAAPARSAAAADGQPGWAEQQAAQEVEAEEASLAASCGRHFSFQQLRQQRRAPQPPPPSSTAAQQQREQPQKQAPVQPRQPRGLLGPPTTVLQQQQRQQPMLSLSLGPHQQALPAVPPADALQAAVATGLGTLPLAAHPATSPQPAAADGAAGGAVANAQPGHAPSESSGAAVPGSGGGEKAGSGGGAALATPAPLDLEAYLPADLAAAMQGACRMRQLFPWQAECLCLPGVMEQGGPGANLVLQAPTGSGKSNVAYVLLLRALRQDGSRKGLLVLPFRQACEEQADRLAPIVAQLDGKLVKRSYGGAYDAALLGRQAGVVVCTPESANTLLNRLLDAGISPAREFSVAVVDEAHMAEEEEGGRGPAYERLLAKLRYAQLEAEERAAEEPGSRAEPEEQVAAGGSGAAAAPPPPERMQVVAMSATLARPHALARCLGARLFRTEYRPVQLDHFLVAGLPGQAGARAVKDAELRTLRVLEPLPPRNGRTDELCIGRLVQQEVEGGQQVLVFCATKKACKVEARRLAALLHIPEPPVQPAPPAPGAAVEAQAGGSTRSPASSPQQQRQGRAYFAARLQELGEQHALALAGLVQGGTAYHHSDVPRPARQLVQAAYQRGAVAALCTTTALKTSVNLPAGAAIFRQAYVSTREPAGWLTLQGYRQMSGRAGRVGLAAAGRSFLVHDPAAPPPLRHLEALLRAAAPSGSAAPGQDDADEPAHEAQTAGLRAALLEAVAGCRARTSADILRFLRCMLSASAAQDPQAVQEAARDALAWLGRPDGDKCLALILYDRELRRYLATPLGRAAFASALPVEEALALHADMKRLSRRLSLLCHLQLCFLSVSPHSTQQMRARHWLLLSQLLAREARDEEAEDALRTLGFAPGTAALAFAHRREREALAVAGSSNPHMPPLAPGPQGQPDRRHERLCSRLFTALALQELLREEPPGLVAARLELANLEELREQSIHFAGRAAAFAARRGWPLLAAVLRQFQLHLRHGCTLEVVPLLALGCVDTPTARLLHNAGLTTLEAVAEAGEEELVAALRHAPTPRGVPAERVEAKRRKLARKIKAAAAKTQADPLRGVLRGSADDGAALGSRTKRKRGGHGARVEAPTAKERQLVAVAHAHDSSSDSALAGGSNDESGGSMERHSGGGESMDEDGTEPASSEGGAGCASGQAAGEVCQQEQHRGQREPAPKLPELHCEPAMGRQQQQQPAEAAHLLPAGMAAEGASPPGPGSSSQLAALGLPSPGLHIVREEQDVLRLCRQLRASSTTCLGFALHVAPGSRVADLAVQQAVPPPPSRKRKREAAGAGGAPPPPGALLGLAVSWASGACAYVPLAGLSAGGSVAAELAALLCEGGTGGSQAATASAATPAQPSLGAAAPVPLRFLATTALQRQVPALRQLAPAHCRVFMPPSWVDARIAAWLLHPGASLLHALTSCSELAAARRLLRQLTGSDAAFESCADLAPVPAAQQGQQTLAAGWRDACAVAAASRAAWLLLLPRLGAGGGWALRVLVEQDMPLVAVLARMEAAGVGVHAARLAKLRSLLELRMGEAALQICQLAGRRVDMNRPADVSRLLYEELRLQPPPGAQPLKSGGYSCNKDAIKLLARRSPHPVLPLIQEWRKAGKTLEFVGQVQAALRAGTRAAGSAAAATEGDATAAAACLRQGRAGQGPRLWTALHQTNTDTGRLTMENPSLQCMPKAHTLQLQSGPQEASVRRALVAAPGCTLLSADYRQVELRILAHLSRDEALLRAFEDGRQDPFRLLAAQWSKHGLQPHQVSSQERTHTKHLTYGGLLYGMGSSRLGEEMGTSAGEAAQRRDEFLASFPGVAALLEQLREGCRAAGYVETLAGRRCPLPGIASPDWRTRGEAERKAVNTPMQGSAADLAKTAMLCIHERLAELGPGAAELLLMVHDELVLEVEQGRLEQAAALVRAAMEEEAPARLGITVPLRVRLSSGPSWGELRELQPGAAQDEHAAAGS